MPEEFSVSELSIIRNMLLEKPAKLISVIVDRGTDDVLSVIQDICKKEGLTSYDDALEQRRANKPKKEKPLVGLAKARDHKYYETKQISDDMAFERPPTEYSNPDYSRMYLDEE